MKLFSAEQIREIDAFTIRHEPIASEQLMERAAAACFNEIKGLYPRGTRFLVFCGCGNNGGDGLALARLLNDSAYPAKALFVRHQAQPGPDPVLNLNRLLQRYPQHVQEIQNASELNSIAPDSFDVLVDALLGTGLNKKIEGLLEDCINWINNSGIRKVISIDIPSGLFADRSSAGNKAIVKADLVLSFQFPKLAFLLAENADYVRAFRILDIGLSPEAIRSTRSIYFFTGPELVSALLKPRSKFSHKGSFGHALLLAGSRGKSGSALLAARACMRSGCGLLSLHTTRATLNALLRTLPEAMSEADTNPDHISEIEKPERFTALAFGPGVGLHEETQRVLKKILHYAGENLIIDADGLNILSENKTWLGFLKANTILTPHVKEFDRLTEKHSDDFSRLDSLRQFAIKCQCIVVLKSAYTAVAMPDGNVFFNSSGNPGLAKAGSGDALTGILLGLLSRGYSAAQSALIGVYVHGLAADLCLPDYSVESMLISDVIEKLPKAFLHLEQSIPEKDLD